MNNNTLKNSKVILGFTLVMTFLVLLSLGTWQIERLQWKEKLLLQINENLNAEPLRLSAIDKNSIDLNYKKVIAEGIFVEELAIELEPRTNKGKAGVHILTPFYSNKKYILVNIGFVPYEYVSYFNQDYKSKKEKHLVAIQGIARLYGKKKWPIPDNDLKTGNFFFPDTEEISKYLNLELEPYIIELIKKRPNRDYPLSNVTIIDIPNNHLQYAITWFGLAMLLSILIIFLSYKSYRI